MLRQVSTRRAARVKQLKGKSKKAKGLNGGQEK
jgi:hypothetical protein